jgi:hypothetical protein
MNTLVLGQGRVVDLHARRALWRVLCLDLVDTQNSTGCRLQPIMVKLEITKGRVEAQVDFRGPRRKLERLHHGCLSRCGVLRLRILMLLFAVLLAINTGISLRDG